MLVRGLRRGFSAAPYNPMQYLQSYVPTELPTKEETFDYVATAFETGGVPVNNFRHINPIRQSGPLPAFDGPFTMEDILENYYQEYTKLGDCCYQSTDAEEIMRRVPGTTREEAEYIRTIGLTPDDEVEFAYIAKNLGLDIFYPSNFTYIARQVVTNSKGEKTEVMWPFTAWEEHLELSVDTALQDLPYYAIRHWEAYSGDEWFKYLNNQDLGVPDTWFEYEKNARFSTALIEDQNEDLPDSIRPWPTPKHPLCRAELFQEQSRLREHEEMAQPEWKHRSPDD